MSDEYWNGHSDATRENADTIAALRAEVARLTDAQMATADFHSVSVRADTVTRPDMALFSSDDFHAMRTRAEAAARAALTVKVKPLVWEETWGGALEGIPCWTGKNALGLFIRFSFSGRLLNGLQIQTHSEAPDEWVDAAKAAAQAYYDARILDMGDTDAG